MPLTNLYSDEKFLHFVKPYLLNNELPLIHVIWFLTGICNHKCSFCFYGHGNYEDQNHFKVGHFPDELVDSVIDDCNKLGVEAITFTGGEPCLAPSFKKIVNRITNQNIGVITNGSVPVFEEVPLNNIAWVRFSINGSDPYSYSKYHGVADKEFWNVLHNLNWCAEAGLFCGVNFLVYPDNIDYLEAFATSIRDYGVKYIRLNYPIHLTGNRVSYPAELLQKIEAICDNVSTDTFSMINMVEKRKNCGQHVKQNYPYCYIKDVSCNIDADGAVYTCCIKRGYAENRLGTLQDSGLYNLWNAAETQKFLRNYNPEEHCNVSCLHYEKNMYLHSLLSGPQSVHDLFV